MATNVERKHLAFMFSVMAGLLAQHVTLTKQGTQRGGQALVAVMADAAEIDPDNIPDDVEAAATEFIQYATSERRVAPDGFNELGGGDDRPEWAIPLSFAGDGLDDDWETDDEGDGIEADAFDTGIDYRSTDDDDNADAGVTIADAD